MEGIVKSGTHRHECDKLCASAATDSQALCASMRKNVSGTIHASTGYMHQNKLHVINKWNISFRGQEERAQRSWSYRAGVIHSDHDGAARYDNRYCDRVLVRYTVTYTQYIQYIPRMSC